MTFYFMFSQSMAAEYARPGDGADALKKGCRRSEFQFLDHSRLMVGIAPDSGPEFADFIVYGGCVPLVSQGLRAALLAAGVDNLFFKPVDLAAPALGVSEPYWLALPPRIECLDREESALETDGNPCLKPWERAQTATKIVINPYAVGNYRIFKLPFNVANQDIIVTGELHDALAPRHFRNLYFEPIDQEGA